MSREFLSIYNYGMGGVWAFITAPSAQAIRDRYPALEVYESHPDYISPARFEEMKKERGKTRGDLSDPTFWLFVSTEGAPPSGPAYRPTFDGGSGRGEG